MDDISIDRLILEIPGLTAARGEELAREIGTQLAASTAGSGEFQTVVVTIDAPAPGASSATTEATAKASTGRLATSIVAAMLRQIG